MDIRAVREHSAQLTEQRLHARHGLLALADDPIRAENIPITLRKRGAVPRHVDLGHQQNIPTGGICDQFTYLLLRVTASRCGKPRERTGGQRIALIVREMQVQGADFVEPAQVNILQQHRELMEVPCKIHHQSAPTATRRIVNLPLRERQMSRIFRFLHQLNQSRHTVLPTGSSGGGNGNTVPQREPVSLGWHGCIPGKTDRASHRLNGEVNPMRALGVADQRIGGRRRLRSFQRHGRGHGQPSAGHARSMRCRDDRR